ncbi:Protoporphyrinogen IX oxidase, menaquinone-dependent (flavodoxin domain) [Chitinophaga eiseniae]|uniref:Protoporphyrinogen IX oxidase, menaquinone-dependent (Flavodoxin domain) n=1 Tax=Chitinophaga eiseniae TaxID=634771 RepID=A0A1T4MAE0_9BACT|nr:flavodoxin domain-containing protein [Chitinophaga eiseniae]SJZ63912.1 Protoporphyrinogen IX oxidase, menaquinone-dependent (flavodoxin domain) [Chitinophaga eiseniae]
MRGIIIFQSKYGATRQYANRISKTLQIPAIAAGEVTPSQLAAADFVILGTSIYIGRMLLRGWLEQQAPILKGKPLFLFVVCATKAEKQEKLNSYVVQNMPAPLLTYCHRYFYPGKIQFRELSFTDKLKVRAGGLMARFMGKPLDVSDFNRIDETLTAALIADVQSFHQHPNP